MVLFDRLIDSFGSCDCLLTRVAPIPRIRSLICAPVGWRLVLGAWANHYISALWICAKSMTTAMLSHDADFWMKPLAHSTGHLPGLDPGIHLLRKKLLRRRWSLELGFARRSAILSAQGLRVTPRNVL